MALIYVEYRARRSWAGLDLFHQVVARNESTWTDSNPEDLMILNIGRTWRLGPEPEYLAIYYTPAASLERLGEWERIFNSGAVDYMEGAAKLAFRIEMAGCYAPLLEPVAAGTGPYYGEFFSMSEQATTDDVRTLYEHRRQQHNDLELHLLCYRIGLLAPEPGGLAIWGLPDYTALKGIATARIEQDGPIKVKTVGVYANVGSEQL
jgi:hypothetical protein